METRVKIVDREGNDLERGVLLDRDDDDATVASKALRDARHVVDRAQTDGTIYEGTTQKNLVKQLQRASAALTPLPTTQQVDAVSALCQSCSDTFYAAYFPMMRDRKK